MKSEVLICILFIVGVAAFIAVELLELKKKNGKLTLEAAEEIALSVISRVALALVTDAERTYGAGTGELKMSACIAKLIEMLPESVVEVVPEEFLKKNLEKALVTAKEKWGKNPRLVNKDN